MPEWLSARARPAPGEARSATLALELTETGWTLVRLASPCGQRPEKRAEKGLFRQYGVESLSTRPLSEGYMERERVAPAARRNPGLLLLPPVHTGTPVLGQQGPTVHGVSTLGESHMCHDWDQSAD